MPSAVIHNSGQSDNKEMPAPLTKRLTPLARFHLAW